MSRLASRIDKLEKRVNVPTAPAGPEFRIISVLAWPSWAQREYDAGDEATRDALLERFEGIEPPAPEQRRRRRPLVNRPPRITTLVVCGILDERVPVDDDDTPERVGRDGTAMGTARPAEPAPMVAEPEPVTADEGDLNQIVGFDPFGYVETRGNRAARLAAEAAMSAAGRPIPRPPDPPDNGPARFNERGELIGGRFKPPSHADTGFYQWDRNGKPC